MSRPNYQKRKKTTGENMQNDSPSGSLFKAKIRVIGIGGGGGSIVSEIGRSLDRASFMVADTDARGLHTRRRIKYFLFGQEITHGLGTGLNPELAYTAAEKEREKILKLFEGQDIIIFIASLGGGAGSGATKVFAQLSKNFHGITFGIFTLPFKFEGKHKYKIAQKALRELRKLLNVSITIPNERIFKVIKNDTAITEAFSMINKNLVGSLESLIDLIYNPGVINIDFADMRSILKGKGNIAFLNSVQASGKDRAEKIVQEILRNPLYQNNNFTAERVLFNIAGGDGLSMFEVDKISRKIAEQNPKAKIIFGISKNPKYQNKIKTTLLMTGLPTGSDAPIPKETPKMSMATPSKIAKKAARKVKKSTVKKKYQVSFKVNQAPAPKEVPSVNIADPVLSSQPIEVELRRLNIVETSLEEPKKTIRRTALEIKREQEREENKKSQQEKEWEIPAFLRKVKFK